MPPSATLEGANMLSWTLGSIANAYSRLAVVSGFLISFGTATSIERITRECSRAINRVVHQAIRISGASIVLNSMKAVRIESRPPFLAAAS